MGMSTSQLSSRLLTLFLTLLLTDHIAHERICITDLFSSPYVFYNCETDLQPPVAETHSTQVVLLALHHVILWLPHGCHKLDRKQPLATSTSTSHKHIILLISGIEPNPGPRRPRFPCVVCTKACKVNQRALTCDTCDHWIHKACVNMTTASYVKMRDSDEPRTCPKCHSNNNNSVKLYMILSDALLTKHLCTIHFLHPFRFLLTKPLIYNI